MKNLAWLFLFCVSFSAQLRAQMVGSDAYVKATSVEIGINGSGGYEGVNQLASPPPAGMHARTTFLPFGFVANPQLNGWATYDGDFFTPGSSENGWGFEIGTAGVSGSNNCSAVLNIPGSITNYSHVGTCYNVDWEGNFVSGSNLHFKVNYFLEEADLFYTMTISITNNTTANIPELYYYRSVDPDNNQEIATGINPYHTQNTIECQPGVGTSNVACVSATSTNPPSQPQSYLGFAGIGPNFRVTYGGFANRDGSDIWNGTGATYTPPLSQTVGSTLFDDDAISLAYKIVNLAPGATHTFKYVIILSAASATNIMTVSYPGSAPPAICDTAIVDTIQNCGIPVPLQITGSTVGNYAWTWSPSTGLSTTTGPSTIANPSATITYTATGVPSSPCVAAVPLIVQFVMEVVPSNAAFPVIAPVSSLCSGSAPVSLSVDSSGGVWMGPGVSTTGVFDPAVSGPGTHQIIYAIGVGPCQRADTVQVVVINSASATITQPPLVCDGGATFNMVAATGGGNWTGTGITNPSAGTFDPSTSGPGSFLITYTIPGTCPATDTAFVNVGAVTIPVTSFSYPAHPICKLEPTALPAPVAGFTTGGTYSASPFGLAINGSTGAINPGISSVNTFTITYTVPATTCGPAGTSTTIVTINPVINPVLGFSYPAGVCETDSALAPSNVPGFTAGGTFTSSSSGLVLNQNTGVIDVEASNPGTYSVTYSVIGVDSLCTVSGTGNAPITINPLPSINTSSDQVIWIGDGVTLIAEGGTTYDWNPVTALSCVSCDTTIASPVTTTTYCVRVVDSVGCVDSTCLKVNVEIPCPTNRNLEVPNAFTPNNDGYNDELCLFGWDDCVSKFMILIYDRWGEKVFESTDPDFCWNGIYKGQLLDPAVFVYFIKATFITTGDTPGSAKSEVLVSKNGNISIVH